MKQAVLDKGCQLVLLVEESLILDDMMLALGNVNKYLYVFLPTPERLDHQLMKD